MFVQVGAILAIFWSFEIFRSVWLNSPVLEMKKGKPKWAKVLGWGDKEKALEVVAESRKTYESKYGTGADGELHPFVRVAMCPNMLHVKQTYDNQEEWIC